MKETKNNIYLEGEDSFLYPSRTTQVGHKTRVLEKLKGRDNFGKLEI
jgi:hypothetical protein